MIASNQYMWRPQVLPIRATAVAQSKSRKSAQGVSDPPIDCFEFYVAHRGSQLPPWLVSLLLSENAKESKEVCWQKVM